MHSGGVLGGCWVCAGCVLGGAAGSELQCSSTALVPGFLEPLFHVHGRNSSSSSIAGACGWAVVVECEVREAGHLTASGLGAACSAAQRRQLVAASVVSVVLVLVVGQGDAQSLNHHPTLRFKTPRWPRLDRAADLSGGRSSACAQPLSAMDRDAKRKAAAATLGDDDGRAAKRQKLPVSQIPAVRYSDGSAVRRLTCDARRCEATKSNPARGVAPAARPTLPGRRDGQTAFDRTTSHQPTYRNPLLTRCTHAAARCILPGASHCHSPACAALVERCLC